MQLLFLSYISYWQIWTETVTLLRVTSPTCFSRAASEERSPNYFKISSTALLLDFFPHKLVEEIQFLV